MTWLLKPNVSPSLASTLKTCLNPEKPAKMSSNCQWNEHLGVQSVGRWLYRHWPSQPSESAGCKIKDDRSVKERGARRRDKRTRLAENNGPVSDGVTRRTMRRRGKITFNDMLSVEASLRLRSATERGKKGKMGIYLHIHVPNTHTYAHTYRHRYEF